MTNKRISTGDDLDQAKLKLARSLCEIGSADAIAEAERLEEEVAGEKIKDREALKRLEDPSKRRFNRG